MRYFSRMSAISPESACGEAQWSTPGGGGAGGRQGGGVEGQRRMRGRRMQSSGHSPHGDWSGPKTR
eukprot:scaffold2574_cov110-Isochrysis_galbana.AAC.7